MAFRAFFDLVFRKITADIMKITDTELVGDEN